MKTQVISGSSVLYNRIPRVENPFLVYEGLSLKDGTGFALNEDMLSRHILLLGASGCGKTNTFCQTLKKLRDNIGQDDVILIFDTKGDFFELFAEDDDYVIGNSAKFRNLSYTWNIFDEILADGLDEENIILNARELAAALFYGRGSQSQPFFCNAAKDLFYGILMHFIRQAKADPDIWKERLNPKDLLRAFQSFGPEEYGKIFRLYPDFRGMLSYIGDGKSAQALGVLGELNSMLTEYMVGIFAKHRPDRSISMRRAIRQKGGKAIFVEYDLSVGETLTPVYRLLIDQALKEALGREHSEGRVYVIADEFKLLPKLQHIDDALNFGRGLGVRIVAGIQSIDQLYDIYGRDRGNVIAGGFGNIFAFRTNDENSRSFISKRFGRNITVYEYMNNQKNVIDYQEREGYTVEEWDQMELGTGQAVIGAGYEQPFLFQFQKYDEQRR